MSDVDDVESLLECCWNGSVNAEPPSETQLLRKQRLEKWKRINSGVGVSMGLGEEEGELEEGEFVDPAVFDLSKIGIEDYGVAVGSKIEPNVDEDDELEEGEFVVDDFVDDDDDDDDVGVGLNAMEVGDFADECEQVGISEDGVGGGFVCEAEGIMREPDSVKEIVEVEGAIIEPELVNEIVNEDNVIAEVEFVKEIIISEEQISTQDRGQCASRFDAKLGQDGVIHNSSIDLRVKEEDALVDAPVGSPHTLKALPAESTKTLVLNQMATPEVVEGCTHKKYPRRSISAKRTFPPGCGTKAILEILRRYNNSVESSADGKPSDHKSNEESWFEENVKADNEHKRKEVRVEDALQENLKGNTVPTIRDPECVHVSEDFDSKLKQKDTRETSFKPFEDFLSRRGLKPSDNKFRSCGESDMRFMNIRNGISLKRKFPAKSVDESRVINQSKKFDVLEPSNKRANIQALMAASDCPWRKGGQASKSAIGLIQATNKSLKKDEFVVQRRNPLNSVLKTRNNEDEDYVSGEDEENDSPLVKRSRNRDLSSTRFGLGRLDDNDGNIQVDVNRNKVRRTLRLFQTIFRILLRDEEGKSKGVPGLRRVDLKTATILKENKKWINSGGKIVGKVPGVEVGDEFHYRVELTIIGMHFPFQSGIDTTNTGARILATSIVASGGYDDDMDSSDVLIYSGQGGNPTRGAKVATDQKLVRGNLALKNSMVAKTPVRVIRGFKESKGNESLDARLNMAATLVYDGLYKVERFWMQKGSYGNNVFMFQLRRLEGQPELARKELKRSKKASLREGLCVRDISQGKERIPVGAVNTVDDERPPPFEYITKMIHPRRYNPIPPRGCGCTDGCLNSSICSCAIKNGGQIPFNCNGAIVESKPLVYECGPKCECPPSCYNRVSQRGMKFPLEVFKTKSRGWGVRSLTSIPSGSFICEYTGKLLQEEDAEQRTGSDEYLFDIGRSCNNHALWEGLSKLIPSHLKSSSLCEAVEDVGFTIDAAQYGNVGRFINHSCSPNLYAQNVLYDHDDKRMPHIMLFAAENIPPLKELTYHYNYALDQVHDAEGNIKKKKCYCGSSECTGRMY